MTGRVRIAAWAVALGLGALGCANVTTRQDAPSRLHGELGLNDVSILFPLPASGALDQLMRPSSAGAHGELLPESIFAHAPALTKNHTALDDFAHLRVVSARIDPCFPSLKAAPSPSCRFQVRLVMQPIYDTAGAVRAEAAAVHLFYDMPVADFVELVSDLLDAQQAAAPIAPGTPLGVHPTLLAEGLGGSYAASVEQALLAKVGAQRLTRMTFAALGADGTTQSYGGFDFEQGAAKTLGILSPEVTLETFANDSQADPLSFSATVQPPLANAPEDLSPLYDSASASDLDEQALWSLYEATLRVENPTYYSSASVDCVSCHAAQPARRWLERRTEFASRPSTFRFASDFDLTVTDAIDDTTALRAFGWQGTEPSLNSRVVDESAAVAAYLNHRLLE